MMMMMPMAKGKSSKGEAMKLKLHFSSSLLFPFLRVAEILAIHLRAHRNILGGEREETITI
jgi:hypothetical protein